MNNLQFTEKQQLVIDILLNKEEYKTHSTVHGAFYSTTKRTVATICELTGFSKRSVVSIIASINRKYCVIVELSYCDDYEVEGLIEKDLNIDSCYEFNFDVLAKLQAEEEVQAEEVQAQEIKNVLPTIWDNELFMLCLLTHFDGLSLERFESKCSYMPPVERVEKTVKLLSEKYMMIDDDGKFFILEKGLKAIQKAIDEGNAEEIQSEEEVQAEEVQAEEVQAEEVQASEEEVQAEESKTIKRLKPSTIKRYTVEQIANHADDYQLAIDTDEYRFDFQFKSIYTKGGNQYYYYMDMLDTDYNKMMITSILESIYQLHDIKIMEESIKQMKGA